MFVIKEVPYSFIVVDSRSFFLLFCLLKELDVKTTNTGGTLLLHGDTTGANVFEKQILLFTISS